MCKLCNTDRPAIKTLRKTSTKLRKEITAIVYDYLGEYACHTCLCNIRQSCKHSNTNPDKVILKKLYNTYRPFSGKQLGTARYKTRITEKHVLGCSVRVYTRLDGKPTIRYMAVLRTLERKYVSSKLRNTLEEAVEDKIELIKKHKGKKSLDAFLKSIERYNQKLKESQNEQN